MSGNGSAGLGKRVSPGAVVAMFGNGIEGGD